MGSKKKTENEHPSSTKRDPRTDLDDTAKQTRKKGYKMCKIIMKKFKATERGGRQVQRGNGLMVLMGQRKGAECGGTAQ